MKPYIPYIILILLVAVAFANSLQNSFVWDDTVLIAGNPKINMPLKEIPSIFIMPIWRFAGVSEAQQIYYRPIISLFYVLNYKIFGPNPFGFHLTHIILHMINAIVLYRIGLLLFTFANKELAALMAASIFAVHPVNTEPVAWASAGETILGFFIILSIYFFLKEKRFFSLSTFFFALLSKETAVMLPFSLLIFAVHKKGIKKGIITIVPYTVLVAVYFILRMRLLDTVFGGYTVSQPMFTRLLTMATAAFDYIRLLVIPYPLKPYYPARWYTNILESKVFISIAVLISVAFFARKIRRDNVMLFLLLFPFFMLAPVIWKVNTFPVRTDLMYIAERFLYMPTMAFSLLVSGLAARYFKRGMRTYMIAGWILVIIILTTITASSVSIWRNNFTLFAKIVKEAPNASFAHAGLGIAYIEMGKTDDAMAEWQIAIELNKNNPEVLNSIGNVHLLKGNYEKAVLAYELSLKEGTTNVEAYYNLALALEKTGKEKEAEIYYKEFIRIAPEKYENIISELKKRFGEK